MKQAFVRILLVTAGLCVGLLLGEAIVRVAVDVPVTPQMFVSDEVTDFRLKPNVRERLVWPGDVRFSWTTNSRGYRTTREFLVPKPASTKRVLLLGDSFTFGQGVDDSQTFAAEAQRRLETACSPTTVEVVNAGVPGFSTSQELALLEHEGLALDPDVVVLGFYGNDPDDNVLRGVYMLAGDTLAPRPTAARPHLYRVKEIVDRVPGYAWLAAHSHLLNLIRRTYVAAASKAATYPSARAIGSVVADDTRAGETREDEYRWRLMRALLSRINESVERANSRLIVFLIPDTADIRGVAGRAVTPGSATPVMRMRTLCAELAIECLDLVHWLSSVGPRVDEKALYIAREFHFSTAGNALAGQFLASGLLPVLGCT